jgi:hypothetical protein
MSKRAAKDALGRGDNRAAAVELSRLSLKDKALVLLEHTVQAKAKGGK